MVTEKMIEALKPCPNCGGKERSWFPANKINTTAQDGRLKSNEISCDFVLGCDECSETLRVVSADEIALRMTSALSTDAEPVGYATEYGLGYLAKRSGSFNLAMTKEPDNLNNIAVFLAPPAPSVAVKALTANDILAGIKDQRFGYVVQDGKLTVGTDRRIGIDLDALAAFLSRSAQVQDVDGDRSAEIRKAGIKARDELLERLADDGSIDNDLADYMERIVDACVRAAAPAAKQEEKP